MFGLTDKVLAMAAGGLSIVLAISLAVVLIQKSALEGQLELASASLQLSQRNLGTCTANTANLEAQIVQQGEAVELLRAQGEARVEELERRLRGEARALSQAEREAAAILSERPQGEQCAAALDLIRRQLP